MASEILDLFNAVMSSSGTAISTTDKAVGLIKSLRELAKGSSGSAAPEIREKLLALQEELASVREINVDLRDALRIATAALKARDDFESQKGRYELSEIYPEAFAYAEKRPADTTAPNPYLCAHCFDNGKKSILQHQQANTIYATLVCPACKNTVLKRNTTSSDMARVKKRDASWMG